MKIREWISQGNQNLDACATVEALVDVLESIVAAGQPIGDIEFVGEDGKRKYARACVVVFEPPPGPPILN